MTLQCFIVLIRLKKLSGNSDRFLRFCSDGMIYPFETDEPYADCSKYKDEIISIMKMLNEKGYISLSGRNIQLSQKGIHIFQAIICKIIVIIYDKWIPFLSLVISFISLAKSYGKSFHDIITWCMQLLRI